MNHKIDLVVSATKKILHLQKVSENPFLVKFQSKTDSELEHILENKEMYTEQAIAASIQILRARNVSTEKIETTEKEIKTEREKKEARQKEFGPTTKKNNLLTDDPDAPELHSKKVITVFCGVFSTIFGAVLLMYNMKATNNQKGRIQVLVFGSLYTILTIVILNSLNTGSPLNLILNLAGAGVLNEYFWNKHIGKEFKYRKRSWVKPLVISLLITIPFILALIYGG